MKDWDCARYWTPKRIGSSTPGYAECLLRNKPESGGDRMKGMRQLIVWVNNYEAAVDFTKVLRRTRWSFACSIEVGDHFQTSPPMLKMAEVAFSCRRVRESPWSRVCSTEVYPLEKPSRPLSSHSPFYLHIKRSITWASYVQSTSMIQTGLLDSRRFVTEISVVPASRICN